MEIPGVIPAPVQISTTERQTRGTRRKKAINKWGRHFAIRCMKTNAMISSVKLTHLCTVTFEGVQVKLAVRGSPHPSLLTVPKIPR